MHILNECCHGKLGVAINARSNPKFFHIVRIYAEHEDEVEELLWRNRIYTKGIVNATNKQFAELDIEGFDFERYILGTYAKKDEVWKRPLTAMKQDIWEQLVKVE
jgi:hypothetical protein